MLAFLARVILWGCRLLTVAIALWWPGVWRDPIYTPRQARSTSQELKLPNGTVAVTPEERAFAIFWTWEHRTFVTTRWVTGPSRGLRNAQGWKQTLLVIILVWGVGSGVLLLIAWLAPGAFARQRRRTPPLLLTTPLWRFLARQRAARLL